MKKVILSAGVIRSILAILSPQQGEVFTEEDGSIPGFVTELQTKVVGVYAKEPIELSLNEADFYKLHASMKNIGEQMFISSIEMYLE